MKCIKGTAIESQVSLPAFSTKKVLASGVSAKISMTRKNMAPVFLGVITSVLITGCGGGSTGAASPSTDSRSIVDAPRSGVSEVNAPGTLASGVDDEINQNSVGEEKPYARDEDYPDIQVFPLQFITTTSGKKMGVRVTLPASAPDVPADGSFPVVLTLSGYNPNMMHAFMGAKKGGSLMGFPDPFMVKRGYAHVIVDSLGTGVSEGGWELLGEAEQAGFDDAIDWIKRQPWSNGKIGVSGISYMAITSLFAAERRPDDVKAVFAGMPLGDAMRGTVGTGGLYNGVFMSTWMTLTQITSTQNVQTALLNPRYMSQIMQTTKEHIDQIDSYFLPMIDAAYNGDPKYTYESEFWLERSPFENIDKIRAPTLLMGATEDIFQRDVPLIFERLKKNNIDSKMVIYDENHVGAVSAAMVGSDKVAPMMTLLLQWFDKHLMGLESGTEAIPAVTQQVKLYPTPSTPTELKNNNFITASDWPHPLATPDRWFLRGDMRLTKTPPINEEPVHVMYNPQSQDMMTGKSDGFLQWRFTLNDGTKCSPSYMQWTLGQAKFFYLFKKMPECFENNAVLEQDHLNYETTVMDEDYFINGPIQADIWMDSTVTEAVVSVRVDEVSKNGKQVTPITNGLLLASGRAVDVDRSRFLQGEMIQPYHYFTEAKNAPLVPGEVVKLQIEIFPTSAMIRKGNKLRISISPSNQAQGMLNRPRQEMAAGGITTIHNSPKYPSSIVLPIVPLSALN